MKRNVLLVMLIFVATLGYSNKTSVRVDVPSTAAKGQETTIKINVSHKGNSKMHHTDWVTLNIDGKEVKKWEFSGKNLPPDEEFTLEYKFVPQKTTEIAAQGHCNIHGSAEPDNATVQVK